MPEDTHMAQSDAPDGASAASSPPPLTALPTQVSAEMLIPPRGYDLEEWRRHVTNAIARCQRRTLQTAWDRIFKTAVQEWMDMTLQDFGNGDPDDVNALSALTQDIVDDVASDDEYEKESDESERDNEIEGADENEVDKDDQDYDEEDVHELED